MLSVWFHRRLISDSRHAAYIYAVYHSKSAEQGLVAVI